MKASLTPLDRGDDLAVIALQKGKERYVFMFESGSNHERAVTLRQLGRFAANPELSFSWYDAAMCSQKIRQDFPASDSAQGQATRRAPGG